jgi:HPt (histidine-containing phosphotransfer) domain-containing protein
VLALSIAALERRIAADPGFAARLFRAIATLAAERLRTTTSQVRRAEHGAQGAAPAGNAPAAAVLDKVASLKRLVAAAEVGSGPVPDQSATQIRDAFAAVEQATHPESVQNADKLADRLQAELIPLIRLSATGERCFAQPRGYPGDYQTIDMIYANSPAGTGRMGPVLDSCVLGLAAVKAIRNRRSALASEILKSYAATSKEFHVACLACGPASEIFDAFEKTADKGRLQVSCIDTDREALSHVSARAQAHKLAVFIDVRRRARKAGGQHVIPAVAVEVINPGEEMIGIPLPRLGLGRINLALLLKARPREPVRSINDVGNAVVVQIAGRDTLRVIHISQLLPLEGVEREILATDSDSQEDQVDGNHLPRDKAVHGGTPWPRHSGILIYPVSR